MFKFHVGFAVRLSAISFNTGSDSLRIWSLPKSK